MVALAVPRFGMVVEVNLARTFLFRAHEALEAGSIFEAGVLLREAIRRQLVAECNWFGCLPKGFNDRTPPMVLLKALRCSKHCTRGAYELAKELIEQSNRCCHAQPVVGVELRSGIEMWHYVIDATPCGEPRERVEHCMPVEPELEPDADYEVDDCDADDRRKADWWKPEGWNPNQGGEA